jgi:hypothetical protein
MVRRGLHLLLARRDFGLLMASQFCAQGGDGLVQAALAKLIVFGGQRGFDLENARRPADLLRIALYLLLPYTVVSPFIGVVIDRWDRRKVLLVANAGRAGVLGLVASAGIAGVGDPVLFGAFLLTLMSTRVVLATKAAALPATLDGRDLVDGNAVSQLGGALAQLGGAGAALVAAGILPVGPVVAAGAFVYGVGAAAAVRIDRTGERRAVDTLRREIARIIRSIAAGVREVARAPKAAASIATYFWLRFLWSFSLVGIGFVARGLLAGDNVAITALTGGAGAAGATLGFLLAGVLQARVRTIGQSVLGAAALAGVSVAALGNIQAKASIAFLAFGLGLGFFVAKISLDTMVQEALGDDFRGRAFSLYDIAYNLAWVGAAALMKLLWAPSVEGPLISGTGLVFLVGLAGLALWFKQAGLLATASVREEAAV